MNSLIIIAIIVAGAALGMSFVAMMHAWNADPIETSNKRLELIEAKLDNQTLAFEQFRNTTNNNWVGVVTYMNQTNNSFQALCQYAVDCTLIPVRP